MAATVECANCGATVTKRYALVMSPQHNPDSVECCPNCPDLLWDGNAPREAKSVRQGNN